MVNDFKQKSVNIMKYTLEQKENLKKITEM